MHTRPLSIALVLATVVVVAFANDGLEFARKLHSEGRNEDALQAVNMAIDRKDDADARVLRGFIKEALGDKEGALEDYNVAAASDPSAAGAAPAKKTSAPADLGSADGSNLSDSYADCKGWGFMCNHDDKKNWMMEYCPLTCHLVATGQQPAGGGTEPQEIPDHLRDKYSECAGWASVCEVSTPSPHPASHPTFHPAFSTNQSDYRTSAVSGPNVVARCVSGDVFTVLLLGVGARSYHLDVQKLPSDLLPAGAYLPLLYTPLLYA